MSIRRASDRDFERLKYIYAQCKMDELALDAGAFTFLPLDKDVKRLAQHRESTVYVYQVDDVVAYGAICAAEVRALYVLPKYRGAGVGRQLFEFLLGRAQGEPSLYIAKANTPAKNLYERYGFTVISQFETEYNGMPVLANKMVKA